MRVPGVGVFVTAPFNVTSHMELLIEAGATVLGIGLNASRPLDAHHSSTPSSMARRQSAPHWAADLSIIL